MSNLMFWKQSNKTEAEIFLNHCIAKDESSKIPILIKFAKTLSTHKFGLLSFYDYPISKGPLEGAKKAYGFRDYVFF
ncbi:MAG: transposase, partial [Flexistipes sinusarabici]